MFSKTREKNTESAEPEAEDWTKALTDLVPIDINHLQIIDGTAAFIQLQADPNINLNLSNVNLNATNLHNIKQQQRTLPSNVEATAVSFGNGQLKMNGKMNLVKEIPDMDIEFSLEKADATALNDLTQHYAKIDFESGVFEALGKVAIADSFKG
jgi:hypothetical protein